MKDIDHEGHEGHKGYEGYEGYQGGDEEGSDPFSLRRMRAASPLSPEADRVMYRTIGCAIAVHRALGPGYLEAAYKRSMCIELESRGLSFDRESPIQVLYRGIPVLDHRVDLIVGGLIVVELKAAQGLTDVHRAQLISYLRMARLRGGLLINFRVRVLKDGIQRIVL